MVFNYRFFEYGPMLAPYRKGLPLESLITHRFTLNEAAEAHQTMQGRSGKITLTLRRMIAKARRRSGKNVSGATLYRCIISGPHFPPGTLPCALNVACLIDRFIHENTQ